jgi:1-acyl-sn-glycerol-3-phosphate acyltransferase
MSGAGGRFGLAGGLRIVRRATGVGGWLLLCLALYPLGMPLGRHNPVARWFLGGALRIVGARLRVTGSGAARESILIANHVSWMDILALSGATGTAFVAHEGLAAHPVMRFLCDLNRTVFIARNERASVAGQVEQVQAGLRESGILTLFPEGTTDDGVTLLPFKSSLLAAVEHSGHTVAIRPVWIDYGAASADIAWVGEEPGLDNVKRVLARAEPITVTVHLLPALTGEQRRDRKAIASAAREAIVSQAGL